MKKDEYLSQLKKELQKNDINDDEDIINEYKQHFAFKQADGYSEEEIASTLGSPQMLALQYVNENNNVNPGNMVGIKIIMSFAALFEIMAYIILAGFVIVFTVSSLVSTTIGCCLIGHFNIAGLIPNMPYISAFFFSISFFAFAVLLGTASYYLIALIKQAVKASIRWHKKVTSSDTLSLLPINPQFKDKTKMNLKKILLWSAVSLCSCIIIGGTISIILSGAVEFWHAWNWFV